MSEIEVESTEEWRPVVGCEGVYSVSSLGRVRRDASGRSTYRGKILRPILHKSSGYLLANLYMNSNRKSARIHCLVAEAFLGPRPEGMDVAHNNGIRTDNRVENLRYASHSESIRDAHRYGGKIGRQKLSAQDVADIRYLLNAGYNQKDLAFAYKCCHRTIYAIKKGWTWSHRLDQTLLVPTAD